jgi:AraC family transcriptional regulator
MKTPTTHQTETTHLPIKSCQAQGWENILVEQFQQPPGEARCDYSDEHTIYLSLAPRPIRLLQIQGGKTHAGL